MGTRIVALGDSHGQHKRIKMPPGDILVHCGDFSNHGDQQNLLNFNQWLGELDYPIKLVTPGNHDGFTQRDLLLSKALFTNATLLIDESIEVKGYKFYFSPWTPEFLNWSWMKPRDQMNQVWDKVPEDIDVLVTHGPPKDILDVVPRPSGFHAGCEKLYEQVTSRIRPAIHIFGHLHGGHGYHRHGETDYYNVSCLDDNYNMYPNPVTVIDI